jgi:hypothetical protein
MTNHEIEIAIARELQDAGAPDIDAATIVARSDSEHASRVALLAELDDLQMLFTDLREALASPSAKEALLTSRWTALDVVAHLASWAAETRREAEALLAGHRLDYAIHFEREGGPRAWNQREVAVRATFGLAKLIEELTKENERLTEMVLRAPQHALEEVVELPRTSGEPAQRWRMPLGAMIAASCWHARLHLRRLLDDRQI